MSKNALAHTSRNEAARLSKENAAAEQNPLLLIPAKAANAVNFFLGCNAHLQKPGVQLTIAFRVRYWLESEGLSVPGLIRAFKTACRPERQAKQTHIGMVMADLSAAVDEVLKLERQKERQRQWKADQDAAAKIAALNPPTAADFERLRIEARRPDPCKTTPSATTAATTA